VPARRAAYVLRVLRSPFAPLVLPLIALGAALARWWVQGSSNVYTALAKRFYIPDPDLGWRVSVQHPIWLGLEVCAMIAAIFVGLAIGGFVIKRRERKRPASVLRAASWFFAVVPLAVPIAAFASGPGPVGGRDGIPSSATAAFTGISGGLAMPAGTYAVVAHEGTAITARVSAGHEAFDARFAAVTGELNGDLRDLTSPITATIRASAASVDTGIGERSKHAREAYLQASKYANIVLTVTQLIAARPIPDGLEIRAAATLQLIGRTHAVELTGTLRRPDAAALGRLGLTGDVLLVRADFIVKISVTALAPDAGDFDGDDLPIHASLVLRHTGDVRSPGDSE
jgi:polyisoprenoid-binding protein YceI